MYFLNNLLTIMFLNYVLRHKYKDYLNTLYSFGDILLPL